MISKDDIVTGFLREAPTYANACALAARIAKIPPGNRHAMQVLFCDAVIEASGGDDWGSVVEAMALGYSQSLETDPSALVMPGSNYVWWVMWAVKQHVGCFSEPEVGDAARWPKTASGRLAAVEACCAAHTEILVAVAVMLNTLLLEKE